MPQLVHVFRVHLELMPCHVLPFALDLLPFPLPCQTIAAAFSHKSPFSAPLEKQDELERIRRAFAAPAAAPTGAAAAAGAPAAAGSSGASAALQGLLGDAAVGGKPLPAAAVAAAGLAAGQQSDHLLLVAAFEMWRLTGAAAGERAAAQVGMYGANAAAQHP
jgi:hypothetical protein